MSARPDTTLYWCLERLATSPNVPFDALYDFVGKLNASHDIQSQFPPLLHIRLILCGLLKTEAVTHDTLKTMNHLERKVAEVYGANAPDMTPPPELMLQVSEALSIIFWVPPPCTHPKTKGTLPLRHQQAASLCSFVFLLLHLRGYTLLRSALCR